MNEFILSNPSFNHQGTFPGGGKKDVSSEIIDMLLQAKNYFENNNKNENKSSVKFDLKNRSFFLHLCDYVVDDLIDHDMLGVLLSPTHFHTYLKLKLSQADENKFLLNGIQNAVVCPTVSSEFQLLILEKYKGLQIPECSIRTTVELHEILDRKLAKATCVVIEHDANILNCFNRGECNKEIENSWHYRRIVGN